MTTADKSKEITIREIYKKMGVLEVNEEKIILDHTQMRISNARMYASLLIGMPLTISVLGYNTYDLQGFVLTTIAVILILLYFKYEATIWYKRISFDKHQNLVHFDRHFPKTQWELKYDQIFFDKQLKQNKTYSTMYYFLSKKDIPKSQRDRYPFLTGYIIASTEDRSLFIAGICQFMENENFPSALSLFKADGDED